MNSVFETIQVRVKDLVPHVKNPRKIQAIEKRKLWERLEKYGLIGIPVRDADGTLISGKQRCELLVQNGLGDEVIDVRSAIRKLTDEEQKEIMILENSHAGEWDVELLKEEFAKTMDLADFKIDMAKWDHEMKAAVEQSNEVPELQIVPKMSEKYSSFVIVCRNEIDENHVAELLDVQVGKSYKGSKIGRMHVLDVKKFVERWQSK